MFQHAAVAIECLLDTALVSDKDKRVIEEQRQLEDSHLVCPSSGRDQCHRGHILRGLIPLCSANVQSCQIHGAKHTLLLKPAVELQVFAKGQRGEALDVVEA